MEEKEKKSYSGRIYYGTYKQVGKVCSTYSILIMGNGK
jgi:hypothetical protein